MPTAYSADCDQLSLQRVVHPQAGMGYQEHSLEMASVQVAHILDSKVFQCEVLMVAQHETDHCCEIWLALMSLICVRMHQRETMRLALWDDLHWLWDQNCGVRMLERTMNGLLHCSMGHSVPKDPFHLMTS
jgi:hypothetical protein